MIISHVKNTIALVRRSILVKLDKLLINTLVRIQQNIIIKI